MTTPKTPSEIWLGKPISADHKPDPSLIVEWALYVQGLVEDGVNVLAPVDLATTGAITLSGEKLIDGTLTSGARVLVKDQADPAENGVYVSAAGAWARAADADTATEISAAIVTVLGGAANGATGWRGGMVATLGTDALHFAKVDSLAPLASHLADQGNPHGVTPAQIGAATAAQGVRADTALQPGDAATPAQGSLADTALQPGDVVSAVDLATRPGEAPGGFSGDSFGDAEGRSDLHEIPGLSIETVEGVGETVVIRDAPAVVAQRYAFPVEPGRIYRAYGYARRLVNTSDPAGHTARVGLRLMDHVRGDMGWREAAARAITRADGTWSGSATFGMSAPAEVDVPLPLSTVYVSAFVELFGADHETAIPQIEIVDVTEAVLSVGAAAEASAAALSAQASANAATQAASGAEGSARAALEAAAAAQEAAAGDVEIALSRRGFPSHSSAIANLATLTLALSEGDIAVVDGIRIRKAGAEEVFPELPAFPGFVPVDKVGPELFGDYTPGLDMGGTFRAMRDYVEAMDSGEAHILTQRGRVYLLDSFEDGHGVLFQYDGGITWENRGVIKGGSGLSNGLTQRRMIRFQSLTNDEGAHHRMSLYGGGSIDVSEVVNPSVVAPNTHSTGIDALSFGPRIIPVVRDHTFTAGVNVPKLGDVGQGGGDSLIFIKEPQWADIEGCTFIGALDLGVYMSGDSNLSRPARFGSVRKCHFWRCAAGIGAKRDALYFDVDGCSFLECGGGVFAGIADGAGDNAGKQGKISNNVFEKMRGNPIRLTGCDNATVTSNTIVDWRREIADGGTTETPVSGGNMGGAVKLEGCRGCSVVGNVVMFKDWSPISTAGKQTWGFAVETNGDTAPVTGSIGNVFAGNTVDGAHASIYLDANARGNVWGYSNAGINLVDRSVDQGEKNLGIIATSDVTNPELRTGGPAGAQATYNATPICRYTLRRDDRIPFDIEIDCASLAGLSGGLQVHAALPFTPRGSTEIVCAVEVQGPYQPSIGQNGLVAIITGGSDVISLAETGPAGRNDLRPAQMLAPPRIRISGEYSYGFNVDQEV